MLSPCLDDDPYSFDFSADSFYFDFSDQFQTAFGFGDFLPADGSLFSFGSYDHEFDNVSYTFSVESYMGVGNHRRRHRKKRRPNHQYRKKSSVKKSCWYLEFLRPGMTRDLTHELLASDKFGEFCNWFRMPLSKVEELTDIFINRGYLKPARSLLRRSEFRERSELFNTALYRLGTGVSFRTCQALCNISTSEVFLFFDTFLHTMHEMWEEYISMPRNITQLLRITIFYKEAGLPGCCGSMDVVHVNWSSCPTGNHSRAKGKGGYPSLAF
jgi:hypothetical protein